MHPSSSNEPGSSTPGPSYMTSKQMADYLRDLRQNKIPRPNGSRPFPTSSLRRNSTRSSIIAEPPIQASSPTVEQSPDHEPVRCSSAQSIHRSASPPPIAKPNVTEVNKGGRPLVQPPKPTSPKRTVSGSSSEGSVRASSISYKENGQRLVERQEAHSLRMALEEIDQEKEHRLYNAAMDEAAELVWQHQNPGAPFRNPDAPYKYTSYSERGAHARSNSIGGNEPDLQLNNKKLRQKNSSSSVSASGGSRSSSAGSNRVPSDSSLKAAITQEDKSKASARSMDTTDMDHSGLQLGKIEPQAKADLVNRRRGSGSRRKPSGGLFRNPDDQIYEEPEEEAQPPPPKPAIKQSPSTLPLRVRRNPFTRVQFAKEGLARSNTDPTMVKKFDRFEIHKNPPSQSRNPGYTSNAPSASPTKTNESIEAEDPKLEGGKEIRSDDIRAATSMKLKDRSAKLPTPTMVSDSPGRPIVSFSQDWKLKEIELKEEKSEVPASTSNVSVSNAPLPSAPVSGSPSRSSTYPPVKPVAAPSVPTINLPGNSNYSAAKVPAPPAVERVDSANTTSMPPIPFISVNEAPPPKPSRRDVPSIAVGNPPVPSINAPSINITPAPIPTINAPSISVSPASIPTINLPDDPPSKRPLPTPTPRGSTRPLPRPTPASTSTRSHYTPAAVRTGALCTQCALPIAGRIVSAAGCRFHPNCFVCHHCGEGLECVAFYPEPEAKRAERVSRIRRRLNGEDVEIVPGGSEEEDGDESTRFYCHLDYHEFFSPRCKSCKTPIEGEVVVACGAEWHVGHFFCAQCGDPFDSQTPFVEKEGYAWCVGCHTNRFSTKCKKCRRPVTDTVVKALGAEWHANCFTCIECNGPFDDGRYFLRGDSQDPVCVKCEERRLKA